MTVLLLKALDKQKDESRMLMTEFGLKAEYYRFEEILEGAG